MRTIIALILLAAVCATAGCSAQFAKTVAPAAEGPSWQGYVAGARLRQADELKQSLFKEDQALLSGEEMTRIMGTQVALPEGGKLVVVRFGQGCNWWRWSEDFLKNSDKIDQYLLASLSGSTRIKEAYYLPSLLTPPQMTIPHLRQASARFQADLILVYNTMTGSFDRQKFLGPDKTRAYCRVEAILVDTRTGIIPWGAVATETFSAEKSSKDQDFNETVARAEQQAMSAAWLRLAEQVARYMEGLPAPVAAGR